MICIYVLCFDVFVLYFDVLFLFVVAKDVLGLYFMIFVF